MTTDGAEAVKAVEEAGRAARGTVADLAGVPAERLDQALRAIADGLVRGSAPVLAANEADMTAAREAGLGRGLLDRLRLDEARQYLAGCYRDCLVNIELGGPGRAVFLEFNNLRLRLRAD